MKGDKKFGDVVGKCWYGPIRIRFQTLINAKCEAPYEWYKDLGIDKGDASRIKNGVMIPPEWLMIKIAQYFRVDSTTIWKLEDLEYIKDTIKKQKSQSLQRSKMEVSGSSETPTNQELKKGRDANDS